MVSRTPLGRPLECVPRCLEGPAHGSSCVQCVVCFALVVCLVVAVLVLFFNLRRCRL